MTACLKDWKYSECALIPFIPYKYSQLAILRGLDQPTVTL